MGGKAYGIAECRARNGCFKGSIYILQRLDEGQSYWKTTPLTIEYTLFYLFLSTHVRYISIHPYYTMILPSFTFPLFSSVTDMRLGASKLYTLTHSLLNLHRTHRVRSV